MAIYRLGLLALSKTVLVAISPDTLPATVEGETVISLGTFDHTHDIGDNLPGQDFGPSHVVYHHVRETLYHRKASDPTETAKHPEGIYDMQSYDIVPHGPLASATGIKVLPVTATVGAAATAMPVKGLPTGTALNANTLNFVSADTAIATVAATGAVTGVAEGTTTIKVSTKDGRYVLVVPVMVLPAAEEG